MSDIQFLTEMFNLKTAKGYDFTITDPSDWVWKGITTFEATFTNESGKEYLFRVRRAKEYGIHARQIMFSYKKSSVGKASQNLTMDPSTFKKALVTFLRIYEAYKSTEDGMKSSGYVVALQKGISKYAPLIVRAMKRAFKSEPKKRLSLVGVNPDAPGNIVDLFYEIKASPYPAFNGKDFDYAAITSNDMFYKLSGLEKSPEAEESETIEIDTEVTPKTVDELPDIYGYYEITHTASFIGAPFLELGAIIRVYATKVKIEYSKAFNTNKITMEGVRLYSPSGKSDVVDLIIYQDDLEYGMKRVDTDSAKIKIQNFLKQNTNDNDKVEPIEIGNKYEIISTYAFINGTDEGLEPGDQLVINKDGIEFEHVPMSLGNTNKITLKKVLHVGKDKNTNVITLQLYQKDFEATLKPITSLKVNKFKKIEDDSVEPQDSYVDIDSVKTDVGKRVRALINSGSSRFKKGYIGVIVADVSEVSQEHIEMYNMSGYSKGMKDAYIVEPDKHKGTYITLSKSDLNYSYDFIDEVEKEFEAAKSEFNKKNSTANLSSKPIANLPTQDQLFKSEVLSSDYYAAITKVEIGPLTLDVASYSIVDITEKLESVRKMLSGVDRETTRSYVVKAINSVERLSNKMGEIVAEEIQKAGLEIKPGVKGISALKGYTGNDYNQINKYLRFGVYSDLNPNGMHDSYKEYVTKQISDIDKLFDNHGIRFPEHLKVYRGGSISRQEIDELNSGGVCEMSAYSSTSVKSAIAHNFAKIQPHEFGTYLSKDGETLPNLGNDGSKQGNKIFMEIDRLDRCLGIFISMASQHTAELELILNRGTMIKCRSGHKIVQIGKTSHDETFGKWYGRFSVVDKESLLESLPIEYKKFLQRLNEVTEPLDDIMFKLGLTEFVLRDIAEEFGVELEVQPE